MSIINHGRIFGFTKCRRFDFAHWILSFVHPSVVFSLWNRFIRLTNYRKPKIVVSFMPWQIGRRHLHIFRFEPLFDWLFIFIIISEIFNFESANKWIEKTSFDLISILMLFSAWQNAFQCSEFRNLLSMEIFLDCFYVLYSMDNRMVLRPYESRH